MCAKADAAVTRSELKEAHEINTDTSHSAEKLEEDLKTLKQKHEQDITTMQRQHEEKVHTSVITLTVVYYETSKK